MGRDASAMPKGDAGEERRRRVRFISAVESCEEEAVESIKRWRHRTSVVVQARAGQWARTRTTGAEGRAERQRATATGGEGRTPFLLTMRDDSSSDLAGKEHRL
eukprot:5872553-Pleurochrysis_carterae.AAC.1